jgi:hypothetical protein
MQEKTSCLHPRTEEVGLSGVDRQSNTPIFSQSSIDVYESLSSSERSPLAKKHALSHEEGSLLYQEQVMYTCTSL